MNLFNLFKPKPILSKNARPNYDGTLFLIGNVFPDLDALLVLIGFAVRSDGYRGVFAKMR